MILVIALSRFLRSLFGGAAAVALENLALRHQLMVLQRSMGRPRLARWDRILWVWLSRLWIAWRSSLIIVQSATVLAGTAEVSSSSGGGSPEPNRSAVRGLISSFAI
jgi:hypothetical protein